MFTLRQMSYFDALARHHHFGRAAESVHVTQPALSAQIADMESRIGCKLVERRPGTMVLTETGARLLPVIRDILERTRQLEDLIDTGRGTLAGHLRIGMIPTVAPYLLPVLLPQLAGEFPKLELKVREAVTESLFADLRDGALDAVIAALPFTDAAFASQTLFRDRFFIATAQNTADVLTSPMTQDAVAVERLLLLEEGHCLRDQALAVCNAAERKRLVNFGATSMTTLLQMVAHGMGLTLLPEIAIGAETSKSAGLTVTPFAPPAPYRDIALFWRQSSERSADFGALATSVRTVSAQLLRPE